MASSPALSSTTTPGFLEGREPPLSPTPTEGDVFTLYDTSTGETFDVTAEEFLPAAMACEMDLSAPDEALNAQAVALYTFYSYQRSQNTGEGADFACDSANWPVSYTHLDVYKRQKLPSPAIWILWLSWIM